MIKNLRNFQGCQNFLKELFVYGNFKKPEVNASIIIFEVYFVSVHNNVRVVIIKSTLLSVSPPICLSFFRNHWVVHLLYIYIYIVT